MDPKTPKTPEVAKTTKSCKAPGCDRQRLSSSDVCAVHLNERLAKERAEREAAEAKAARSRGRPAPRKPAGPEPAGAGGAGVEPVAELRVRVLARIDAALEGLAWPLALGPLHPRQVARTVTAGIARLPGDQQADAWRAIDSALERGTLDRRAWNELGAGIGGALSRAGDALAAAFGALLRRREDDLPARVAGFPAAALAPDGRGGGREPRGASPGPLEDMIVRAASALGVPEERVRRRLAGDYETDPFGYDPDVVETIRPLARFFYRSYFRVETTGLEHVPVEGPAVIVANHSGLLPWDGAMLATALLEEHPAARSLRLLALDRAASLPFLQALFQKTGVLLACPENGERLLRDGHVVGVFPEGVKGLGKPFYERYRLARFGRGGFIRMALRAGAPVIPAAIVGAEEAYLTLARLDGPARLLGLPFIPITATFPWLGPLGLIPFPTRFRIRFGKPFDLAPHDAGSADDFLAVSHLANEVRNRLQSMVDELVAERQGVFA